jgi:voltage-gated potassium channel
MDLLSSSKWAGSLIFTVMLICLVALATVQSVSYVLIVMLATIAVGVAFFFIAFPGSRFFSIAFANNLAVYMCFFVFFKETNFTEVTGYPVAMGFMAPILAFLGGAWLRREEIRSIVLAERVRDARHFGKIFFWLIPVTAIGAATFALPELGLAPGTYVITFLVAMALIASIVFFVSADVCSFLLDSGLLFEEFFGEIRRLFVPAYAFFTFYSLLVIIFAALYRVIDRYSMAAHFVIDGQGRDITFSESLYFSIISMSTVGYGDVLPASDIVRVVVAIQIMLGVVLLLFGVSEILRYSREKRRAGHDS